MPAGESHRPGQMTFAVTKDAASKFCVGEPIGTGTDLHGDPMIGRVIEVKPGNEVALVVVEITDA